MKKHHHPRTPHRKTLDKALEDDELLSQTYIHLFIH
jgi:hypothetical protein